MGDENQVQSGENSRRHRRQIRLAVSSHHGQERNADARARRREERHDLVRAHGDMRFLCSLLDPLTAREPDEAIVEQKQLVAREIAVLGRSVRVEIAAGSEQRHGADADATRHQRVVIGSPVAQGYVGFATRQVEKAVAGAHLQSYSRISRLKSGYRRRQQFDREELRYCKAYRALGALVLAADAILQRSQRIGDPFNGSDDAETGARQYAPFSTPFEKPGAELRLKGVEPAQYSCAIDTQGLRRRVHRAPAFDGKNDAEIIPVQHGASIQNRLGLNSRKTDKVRPVAQYCCISRLKIGEIEVSNYLNSCFILVDSCNRGGLHARYWFRRDREPSEALLPSRRPSSLPTAAIGHGLTRTCEPWTDYDAHGQSQAIS